MLEVEAGHVEDLLELDDGMYSSRTSTTRPEPPTVLMVSDWTWKDSTTEDSGRM